MFLFITQILWFMWETFELPKTINKKLNRVVFYLWYVWSLILVILFNSVVLTK